MRTLTDADSDRHAAEIADRGYTIVEDAFDAVFGKEVLDALDAVIEARQLTPADNGFEGRSTYRVYNLLVHGEVFQRIPAAPSVLPVVERVLDKRLARLCGYGTYHGLIGHIDKTDPLRLLDRDDVDDSMLWDAG